MTTAISLDDDQVADHPRAHFTAYAKVVADLSQSIPDAVIDDLPKQGFPVNPDAVETVRQDIEKIWESV